VRPLDFIAVDDVGRPTSSYSSQADQRQRLKEQRRQSPLRCKRMKRYHVPASLFVRRAPPNRPSLRSLPPSSFSPRVKGIFESKGSSSFCPTLEIPLRRGERVGRVGWVGRNEDRKRRTASFDGTHAFGLVATPWKSDGILHVTAEVRSKQPWSSSSAVRCQPKADPTPHPHRPQARVHVI